MVQLAVLVFLLEKWTWQRQRSMSKTGGQTIDAMLSIYRVYLVAKDPQCQCHDSQACLRVSLVETCNLCEA